MTARIKTIIKYFIILIIGLLLAFTYSYIINHDFSVGLELVISKDFSVEIIIVFFALYVYMIAFTKFLIKLFK